jgi:hypothetical protein
MALRCNGNQFQSSGVRHYGATVLLSAYPSVLHGQFHMTGNMRNITAGEGITDDTVSLPSGYRHPRCWMMPQKAGALAARNMLIGTGTLAAAALAVKLAAADITGSGDLSALGSLVVQALAGLTGTGGITDANLQAFLAAVASLSGSGGITSANASGLAELIAALTGDGTAATSILTALGELTADLTVTGTGLSTGNVGQAVWSALAASNNDAGTMGEKLNDAGSASNPWTEVIESGYTAAQILKLIAAAVQGDATGLDGSAVVFKSLDGTTDRITATQDGTNRTVTARAAD